MRKLDPVVKDYLARTPWRTVVQDQLNAMVEALDGNKSAIARRLGVSRRTVYNRLGKCGK